MYSQLNTRAIFPPAVLLTIFLAAGCSDSTSPAAPEPDTLESRVQDLMSHAVGADLPGVSLRIVGDGIDLSLAAGLAAIISTEPMTVDHRAHVASVDKSFVGAAFAR